MKFAVATILFALSCAARAEMVLDDAIQFSIDAPGDAKVDREATREGRSVSVVFRDSPHKETVIVRARMLTKGGKFGIPIPSVFTQIVAGMSSSMGTNLAEPIRTFSHQGRTFYVATHSGKHAGAATPKGITTAAYFAEKDTWHKVILLQFISDTDTALSDVDLMERFTRLKYQPEK